MLSNKFFVFYTYKDLGPIYVPAYNTLLFRTGASVTGAIGIGKSNTNAGSTATVSYGPEVSGFTGLTQGSYYYAQNDGTLGTTQVSTLAPVGIALSSTKMKLLI
jgi:hypothetical protein